MRSHLRKIAIGLFILVLLVFTFLYFLNTTRHDWIYTGDSLNSVIGHAFQHSGFARGEYPIWNPLVRAGDNGIVFQMIGMASPIYNMVTLVSVLLHNTDIVLCHAIYIYLMIILYAIGIFLLVSALTKDFYSGLFSFILTLSSSSVFFATYHETFIIMLHSLPWILYSLIMYFREFRFRYLVMFSLAICILLYSYEAVMGLLYLFLLFVSFALVYFKEWREGYDCCRKIPRRHFLAFGSLLFVFPIPIFSMFLEYQSDLLPISRVTNIKLSDLYTLNYDFLFNKIRWFYLLRPEFYCSLFTGFAFGFEYLRHYIVPAALPFLVVTVLVLRRKVFALWLTALLTIFLTGEILPSGLLLRLPILNSIRNLHFFAQYFLMTVVILAGLGFGFATKQKTDYIQKWLNLAGILFTLLCSALFFYLGYKYRHHNISAVMFQYNILAFLMSVAVIWLLLYVLGMLSSERRTTIVLAISAVSAISSFVLIDRLPVISGGVNFSQELLALRDFRDNKLKFSHIRPDEIQTMPDSERILKEFSCEFGADEFYSLLMLRDNSYNSKGKGNSYGFSSFPFLKNYYSFSLLPGHELLMRNKFFFFPRFFVSAQGKDMIAFKTDPQLFAEMLNKGVGMVSPVLSEESGFLPGPFSSEQVKRLSTEKNVTFSVDVKDYQANRIVMTVTADQPGLFTYTDMWDKGWRVKVDGNPATLKKVFHTFKGVVLSDGSHTVEYFYVNNNFLPILAMNIVFWMCFLGLVISYLLPTARVGFRISLLGNNLKQTAIKRDYVTKRCNHFFKRNSMWSNRT